MHCINAKLTFFIFLKIGVAFIRVLDILKTNKRKNGTGSVLANFAGVTLLVAMAFALSSSPPA